MRQFQSTLFRIWIWMLLVTLLFTDINLFSKGFEKPAIFCSVTRAGKKAIPRISLRANPEQSLRLRPSALFLAYSKAQDWKSSALRSKEDCFRLLTAEVKPKQQRQYNVDLNRIIHIFNENEVIQFFYGLKELSTRQNLLNNRFIPDLITMTTLVNQLQKYKSHQLVYEVYVYLIEQGYSLDVASLEILSRSFIYHTPVEDLLSFLNYHLTFHNKDMYRVVQKMISQYKYVNLPPAEHAALSSKQAVNTSPSIQVKDLLSSSSSHSSNLVPTSQNSACATWSPVVDYKLTKFEIMNSCEALYSWVVEKMQRPSIDVLNAYLSVSSKYGDVSAVLRLKSEFLRHQVPFNLLTYNILLHDSAVRYSDPAQQLYSLHTFNEVLTELQSNRMIKMDEGSYFGILKLLISQNDEKHVHKIVQHMKAMKIEFNFQINALLMKFFHQQSIASYERKTAYQQSPLSSSTSEDPTSLLLSSILTSSREKLSQRLKEESPPKARVDGDDANDDKATPVKSLKSQSSKYIAELIRKILAYQPPTSSFISSTRGRYSHSFLSTELFSEVIKLFLPDPLTSSSLAIENSQVKEEKKLEENRKNVKIRKILISLLKKANDLSLDDLKMYMHTITVLEKRKDYDGVLQIIRLIDKNEVRWKEFAVKQTISLACNLIKEEKEKTEGAEKVERFEESPTESKQGADSIDMVYNKETKEKMKEYGVCIIHLLFQSLRHQFPTMSLSSMSSPTKPSIYLHLLNNLIRSKEYLLVLDLIKNYLSADEQFIPTHLPLIEKVFSSFSSLLLHTKKHPDLLRRKMLLLPELSVTQLPLQMEIEINATNISNYLLSFLNQASHSLSSSSASTSMNVTSRMLQAFFLLHTRQVETSASNTQVPDFEKSINFLLYYLSNIRSNSSSLVFQLDQTFISEFIHHVRTYGITSVNLTPIFRAAIDQKTEIPFHMVSSILSFLYRSVLSFPCIHKVNIRTFSEGKNENVLELYRLFYSKGYINHWLQTPLFKIIESQDEAKLKKRLLKDGEKAVEGKNREMSGRRKKLHQAEEKQRLILDLHGFSRGMAFAAIHTALSEVRRFEGIQEDSELIVITGKNLAPRFTENNMTSEVSLKRQKELKNTEDETPVSSFRLVDEIQSVLVEEFYPSISSSTVPNNPGRILISVKDIN